MSVLTNVGYDNLQPYNHAGKFSVIDFVIALFLIIWRTRLIASLQSVARFGARGLFAGGEVEAGFFLEAVQEVHDVDCLRGLSFQQTVDGGADAYPVFVG